GSTSKSHPPVAVAMVTVPKGWAAGPGVPSSVISEEDMDRSVPGGLNEALGPPGNDIPGFQLPGPSAPGTAIGRRAWTYDDPEDEAEGLEASGSSFEDDLPN